MSQRVSRSEWSCPRISIDAAAFTANGRHLAIIDPGEGLSVFDAITGEKVAGPVPDTASVAVSHDGLLVASTHTGDLLFRDTGHARATWATVPAGAVLSDATLEFSADGSLLRASALHHTQLFDVASRTPLGEPVASGSDRAAGGRPVSAQMAPLSARTARNWRSPLRAASRSGTSMPDAGSRPPVRSPAAT